MDDNGNKIGTQTLWDGTNVDACEYKTGARLGLKYSTKVSDATLYNSGEIAKAFTSQRPHWRETGQGSQHQFEIYLSFGFAVGSSPLGEYDLAHEEKHLVIAGAAARRADTALKGWYHAAKRTSISGDAILAEVKRRSAEATTIVSIAGSAFDLEHRTLIRLGKNARTDAEVAEVARKLDVLNLQDDTGVPRRTSNCTRFKIQTLR